MKQENAIYKNNNSYAAGRNIQQALTFELKFSCVSSLHYVLTSNCFT